MIFKRSCHPISVFGNTQLDHYWRQWGILTNATTAVRSVELPQQWREWLKTLPEAQRTQGIAFISWMIFLTEINLKVASLVLVPSLAKMWCNLYWFQLWPPCGARAAGIVAALQPGCEEMEREWGNGWRMRKWKENKEMEKGWGNGKRMRKGSKLGFVDA